MNEWRMRKYGKNKGTPCVQRLRCKINESMKNGIPEKFNGPPWIMFFDDWKKKVLVQYLYKG